MSAADLPTPRRFLVVRNPAAGRRHPRLLEAVLAEVTARGHVAELRETHARGDARQLARDADSQSHDVVVAAGGDGTINEVVNGLMQRKSGDLALGIIALGTANVLAREIGVGTRVDRLAAALCDGPAVPVHVGRLTLADGVQSFFLLMVGAGFDAHVVAGVDGGLKRRLGKSAYVWRTLAEMVRYRDRRYRVEVDGNSCHAASVICSKGRHYGGPFVVAPAADLRSPALSVCLFERGGRLQVVRYGVALVTGRLPSAQGYRIIDARRVHISAGDAAEPVQVDGDHFASLPVDIDLAPRQLRLLMPRA
jgi:YegS/Rv2252/BmrU family lipid kinase